MTENLNRKGEQNMKTWNELTEFEKCCAAEQYMTIRECEEGRNRDETNEDYTDLIDPAGVEGCAFDYDRHGNIQVII